MDWKGFDALLIGTSEHSSEICVNKSIHISGEDLVVGKESMWPSKKVQFESTYQEIRKIWDNFLSPNSPHQICE